MLRRIAYASCAWLALCAGVVQAAEQNVPDPQTVASAVPKTVFAVRLPQVDAVSYRGIPNFDGAGAGAFNMLYPAPHPAGLLVAVITHAVIADSAQSRQRRELEEAADRVLTPYRSVLTEITHRELIQRAGRVSKCCDVRIEQEGALDPALIFYMTSDQRALALHATFTAQAVQPHAPRTYTVRVIGQPQEPADPVAFWTADAGERLKSESAVLLAHAFDLAASEINPPAPSVEGPERTFRYMEGTVERMERAKLVHESCGRATIRTLRGELMSIPVRGCSQ